MKNERSFNKSSAINQSTKSDWDDAKTKIAEAKDSVLNAMNHSIADKKNKVVKKATVAALATIMATSLATATKNAKSYSNENTPVESALDYRFEIVPSNSLDLGLRSLDTASADADQSADSVQPKHLRTEPRQPKHLRTEPLTPKHLAADLDESVE
ncbi:hypothetical protein [Candidatus Nanoperiomorbus periodonticus]|uniref:hypothetical protein n=1 Tax=Candidatus Nanoperiomorbus periodonticus TaxID=2171989 RepID=UPI00101D6278|nr:hypothetical protein [Candidatus Nanoperiomorbus periodonticus]RYC75892.1 hypothetical protein G52EAM_00137 [Candidatus Nanoperiomorbus periodonticus]